MDNSSSMHTAIEALRDVLSRSPIRREIITLLLAGLPRKAIAARLNRSEYTIDDHIKAIYRATATGDKARLAVIAVLSGIDFSPPPPKAGGVLRTKIRPKVRGPESNGLRLSLEEDVCCTSKSLQNCQHMILFRDS